MSHELELVEGVASFAFNGKSGAPWHKLGTEVDGLQTADVMLQLANADYDVWTEPVYVLDENGEAVEVDNRFATVRINPHTQKLQAFGVFTGRYTVVQNREVLERALAIVGASGGDAVIDTLGVMYNGAQFFASIDLGSLIIDPMGARDEVGRYILAMTSHDGTAPTSFANTNIRTVCKNTCRLAQDEAKSIFKARHTPNAEDRMAEAQRVLGLSTKWAESFQKQAMELMAIPVPASSARFDKVVEALWPERDADTDRKKANRDGLVTDLKVTFANNRNAGKVGENGWAMLNTITEYFDWHRSGGAVKLIQDAMNPAGLTATKKVAAQRAILSLVN